MAGVIDRNGQQWERCSLCGRWVRIQNLQYEPPSSKHKYGLDLCAYCAKKRKNRSRVLKLGGWHRFCIRTAGGRKWTF